MKKKSIIKLHSPLPVLISIGILASSCEKEITLDIPQAEPKLVVEGFIESGLPPFISLTQTVPFYGEINFNELDNYYVHDAEVIVSDGSDSITLAEFCLDEIPDELKPLVAEFLGLQLDDTGNFAVNVCLYTDPAILTGLPSLIGVPGKTYTLTINNALGKSYTSVTNLPELSYLDSVYIKHFSDPDTDSLYILYAMLSDPDTLGNHYRYFTKRNDETFYAGFPSVADDLFFNGKTFEFNLSRGSNPTEEYDPDKTGYFFTGDTIVLKWATIDKSSYDFFRTLEADFGSDGPFSSATLVQSNISNGGLGVWCGYGVTYDTVYVVE
jgi:hypothetical protein